MNQMVQIGTAGYQTVFDTKPIPPISVSPPQWVSRVEDCLVNGRYKLTKGDALCAVSCVIAPQKGDTVLCYSSAVDGKSTAADKQQQTTYILAVLQREEGASASLTVPNCNNLKISQSSIQCHAREQLELGCLKDIKLTSVKGNVEMRAQNLVQTIVGSIIESARERISNADFIQFCASFLTRIHSNQSVITADSDIKIDAERVNLG